MKLRLPVAFMLLALTAMIGCKKGSDVRSQAEFQPITIKFGQDATPFTINQSTQTLKNLPRSCDPTQLAATTLLPSGYAISPDPSTTKNYTTGVTYTIKNARGNTYTVQITAPVYDPVNNPHGIYTVGHLNDIRNGLNDSYVLMNDLDMPDLNAAASVGISDYATYGWYSIGTSYVNGGHVIFRGTVDGQNHAIRNFTCSYRGSSGHPTGIDPGHDGKSYDGLFGYAIRANFKNLGIQLSAGGIKDVDPDGSGYGPVGGLLGYGDSCSITNCYVMGNASIAGNQYTGGLIGKATNSTISKSYSALTPASGNYAILSGSDAGGLAGWALYCEISDSYSSSSVIGTVSVGGLIGMMNTTTVKTSYASGNVAEIPSNVVVGFIPSNNLGGLIGTVTSISPASSIIQNSYATGTVAGANGSNSVFHQGSRIGGLIGQINSISGPVSVTFCYASGTVSRFHTSSTVPYLTGGLVGNTSNNIFISGSNCTNYWDKEKTGQTVLGGGNGSLATDNAFTANGKTSAEMKTTSTFVNWDFSSVWTMAAGTNNGYPSLRSLNK
jgi:hypothetical protein